MSVNLLALAAATAVLVSIPGPNVALIVATSLRSGLRAGFTTVFGTTLGVAIQLLVVAIGLAAIVELAANVLAWLRWAGVAYLVWLGIATWRAPVRDGVGTARAPRAFLHGAMIAALNPKTLLFNAAFLPQFMPADPAALDAIAVAGVFLGVIVVGDCLWALFASAARRWLERHARFRNRLTGGFLVAAGAGLALSRRVGEGLRTA